MSILKVMLTLLDAPDCGDLCILVARWTAGYVGADLALVCQDVAIRRFRRKKQGVSTSHCEYLYVRLTFDVDIEHQCQSNYRCHIALLNLM